MRPCTYTVTRHRPRQQKQGVSQSHDSDEYRMSLETHTATTSDANTSPVVQQDLAQISPQGPVSANLNNAVMNTVVSNGNDALNFLFEAAQREERGINDVREPGSASSPMETSPTTSSTASLPVLSPEPTET